MCSAISLDTCLQSSSPFHVHDRVCAFSQEDVVDYLSLWKEKVTKPVHPYTSTVPPASLSFVVPVYDLRHHANSLSLSLNLYLFPCILMYCNYQLESSADLLYRETKQVEEERQALQRKVGGSYRTLNVLSFTVSPPFPTITFLATIAGFCLDRS